MHTQREGVEGLLKLSEGQGGDDTDHDEAAHQSQREVDGARHLLGEQKEIVEGVVNEREYKVVSYSKPYKNPGQSRGQSLKIITEGDAEIVVPERRQTGDTRPVFFNHPGHGDGDHEP